MKEEIQWHSPFRGAVKIELEEYQDILEYIDEKVLTKKPLLIDLLVIKKQKDKKIDNPIAHIFRKWNILEYKSPTDYVSIDDVYKVNGYACILKSDADAVDEIKFQELSITFVCSTITQNVFQHMEAERKYQITKYENGIYYLLKDGEIPIQFIILDELDAEHKWLVALTDQITKEMLHSLVIDYREVDKNEYKEAILEVVLKANLELVKLLKEDDSMSNEILELFRPKIEEEKRETEQKVKREMAQQLYQMKMPIAQIIQVTKLTEEEVLEAVES
ncbi:3-isopropylmalate dehydrogenase [Anaerosporobacter sp.]|uniref:3-isopropylmalate dehydrogenase n=1 Tax=Anaerosporobacter sp. TaxID=1872529 RepID=UPI00286EF987|nr:3-isopropylmalate dehydrogenase [Anaerosporobacter sp.]